MTTTLTLSARSAKKDKNRKAYGHVLSKAAELQSQKVSSQSQSANTATPHNQRDAKFVTLATRNELQMNTRKQLHRPVKYKSFADGEVASSGGSVHPGQMRSVRIASALTEMLRYPSNFAGVVVFVANHMSA